MSLEHGLGFGRRPARDADAVGEMLEARLPDPTRPRTMLEATSRLWCLGFEMTAGLERQEREWEEGVVESDVADPPNGFVGDFDELVEILPRRPAEMEEEESSQVSLVAPVTDVVFEDVDEVLGVSLEVLEVDRVLEVNPALPLRRLQLRRGMA